MMRKDTSHESQLVFSSFNSAIFLKNILCVVTKSTKTSPIVKA